MLTFRSTEEEDEYIRNLLWNSLQLRAEAGGRDLLEEARLIYSDAADQYLQYRHRVRGAEKRTTH